MISMYANISLLIRILLSRRPPVGEARDIAMGRSITLSVRPSVRMYVCMYVCMCVCNNFAALRWGIRAAQALVLYHIGE